MKHRLLRILRFALRLEVWGTAAVFGAIAFSITISVVAIRPSPPWPAPEPASTNDARLIITLDNKKGGRE